MVGDSGLCFCVCGVGVWLCVVDVLLYLFVIMGG